MPWIKSDTNIESHPNTVLLNALLGVERSYREMDDIWRKVAVHAPDGDLSDVDDRVIAGWAGHRGDATIFVGAITLAGWMDGERRLLEWAERQDVDVLLAMREREREAMAPRVKRTRGPAKTSSERAAACRARKTAAVGSGAAVDAAFAADAAFCAAAETLQALHVTEPPLHAAFPDRKESESEDREREREALHAALGNAARSAARDALRAEPLPAREMSEEEHYALLEQFPPPASYKEFLSTPGRLHPTLLEDWAAELGVEPAAVQAHAFESYNYFAKVQAARGQTPWIWPDQAIPRSFSQTEARMRERGLLGIVRLAAVPAVPQTSGAPATKVRLAARDRGLPPPPSADLIPGVTGIALMKAVQSDPKTLEVVAQANLAERKARGLS